VISVVHKKDNKWGLYLKPSCDLTLDSDPVFKGREVLKGMVGNAGSIHHDKGRGALSFVIPKKAIKSHLMPI